MIQHSHTSISVALRLGAIVAAVAIATVTGLVAAPAAQAAGTGAISGTFTVPASGIQPWWTDAIRITARGVDNGAWVSANVNTSAKSFSIPNLAPGQYRVDFGSSLMDRDEDGFYEHSNLVGGYYGGGAGTVITVTDGGNTVINYTFKAGRTVTGTVSLGSGANAVWKSALRASVNIPGPEGCECGDSFATPVNPTTGAYVIRGLPERALTVYFYADSTVTTPPANLIPEYYNNSYSWAGATPVDFAAGNRSNINATLEVGRTLSGTVSLPGGADATALKGVEVFATGDTGVTAWTRVNTTTGAYTFYGLAPDKYQVRFSTSNWSELIDDNWTTVLTPYAAEYYNNSATMTGATKVSLTSGNAAGINALLDVGRSISGTVTLGAGTQPAWLTGAWVSAEDAHGNYRSAKVNPATGAYTLQGLAATSYTVEFTAGGYNVGDDYFVPPIAFEFHNNQRSPHTATPVSVAAGNVTGLDAVLDLQVGPRDFYTTPVPTVTGTPAVGQTLTAATGSWAPWVETFTYQWKRNGNTIPSATAKTYAVTQADAGATITVAVTAASTGYNAATLTSVGLAVPTTAFTTAPTPTITGTATVGQALTAVPGAWSPAATLTYQWLRNGASIPSATGSTYTLVAADLDATVTVAVTGTLVGYTTTVRQAQGVVVGQGQFSTAPTPTITGPAQVFSILTAHAGTWVPVGDLAFQWLRNGEPIAGAVNGSYGITEADGGAAISVRVTATREGYAPTQRTSAAVFPQGQPFVTVGTPTISGLPHVGQTVTAAPGSWSPAATFTYQWLRGGVPIEGATDAQYTPVAADAGAGLSVRVTGSALSYQPQSPVSDTVTVGPGAFSATPTPTVSGAKHLGGVLAAKVGTWSPAADAYAYQWYRNGAAIANATKGSYTLVKADSGKTVTVKVTGTKAGYTAASKSSAAVTLAKFFTTSPAPKITGTVKVGSTLKAATGTWSPKPSSFAYQWYRDGKAISKATKAQYKLTTADAGKKITVKVTGKKAGYASTPKASAAKSVPLVTFAKAPVPKVTGTAKVGSTLKVTVGTWSPKPAYTYQWYRNGAAISGATKASYKLLAADKGKAITVKVTGKKTGYKTVTKTSAKTAKVK